MAKEFIAWCILKSYQIELAFYIEEKESQESIDEICADDFFVFGLLILALNDQEQEEWIDQLVQWNINQDKENNKRRLPFLLGEDEHEQAYPNWKKLSADAIPKTNFLKSESLKRQVRLLLNCVINDKVYVHQKNQHL